MTANIHSRLHAYLCNPRGYFSLDRPCFFVPDLGLSCKWLGGDGLPSLTWNNKKVKYTRVSQVATLTCLDKDFPVLSDGE